MNLKMKPLDEPWGGMYPHIMEYGPVDGGWSMDDEKSLTFAIFKDHNQLLYLF